MIHPVVRDDATAEFFAGTRRGVLLVRRSVSTGEMLGPSQEQDSAGNTETEWVEASGRGKVLSWAFVPRRDPVTSAAVEVTIVLVELDEGPWWWTQLVDVERDTLREGLRVRAVFPRSGPESDHEFVPVFTADDDA